ncbi:unnamed protein product [Haemonchus placei]|uniref:Reverse transcriptase domain-containing protein n=1 Tax=Haemonchus placei TaxID=6290 RepID=A0A0N4WIT7_HAEPC|nr:unnamed protein product [Haemonchus placei]
MRLRTKANEGEMPDETKQAAVEAEMAINKNEGNKCDGDPRDVTISRNYVQGFSKNNAQILS